MARKVYHVTPSGDGDWRVKREGSSRADSVHEDKADAVERAKGLAKDAPLGQVVIHDREGKIQTEHTYRQDPYPPKG